MNEITEKYKKGARRTVLIFYIIVIIVSLGFVAGGTAMLVTSQETVIIVLSIIMFLVAISNVAIFTRFLFVSRRRIANMSDKEAIERYNKIHGELK